MKVMYNKVKEISLEEVKELCSNRNTNFMILVSTISKYLLQDKAQSLNSVIEYAKDNRHFNSFDLIKVFIATNKYVLEDTYWGRTDRNIITILKTVWEQSHILPLIITRAKQRYKLFEGTKVETEEEKKLRLNQEKARRMREAKERKRQERLREEALAKLKEQDKEDKTEKDLGKYFSKYSLPKQ